MSGDGDANVAKNYVHFESVRFDNQLLSTAMLRILTQGRMF